MHLLFFVAIIHLVESFSVRYFTFHSVDLTKQQQQEYSSFMYSAIQLATYTLTAVVFALLFLDNDFFDVVGLTLPVDFIGGVAFDFFFVTTIMITITKMTTTTPMMM